MKARIRIWFYDTGDKGVSISFTPVYPDGSVGEHFWDINYYYEWFYNEQHLM